MKFSTEDQQIIQTREFSIQEVVRRFGVSPYVLGDLSHATFSNIEQQAIQELRKTLLPRIVKIEKALNNKLFSEKDKKKYSVKYNMDAFLRGDTSSRYAAFGLALQNGWMNINEVKENEKIVDNTNGDLEEKLDEKALGSSDKTKVSFSEDELEVINKRFNKWTTSLNKRMNELFS